MPEDNATVPEDGTSQSNAHEVSQYEDSVSEAAISALPVEPLSSVYRTYAGKIPDKILRSYSEAFARLLASEVDLRPYRKALTDYEDTRRRIDTDRTKVTANICPIDEALTRLEKMSVKTIKLNELVLKPEKFDGKDPKPRLWLQDYEEAIIANGWDDAIAIKYLPTFLKGDAKDWYLTEIKPITSSRNPRNSWAQVHEAFCASYLGEGDYEALRKEIDRAMQKPDELACSYVPRMRRLLLLLDPLMSEGEQVRQLKLKLRPEFRKFIAICDPRTIGALKEAMIKLESTSAKEPGRVEEEAEEAGGEPRAQEQGNPSRKPRHEFRRKEAPMRYQQSSHSLEHQSQPQRLDSPQRARKSHVVTCYCCGKSGHYSYECRSNPQGERQTSFKSRRNPAHTVNTVAADYSSGEQQPHQVLTVRTAQTSKAERKPRFSISEIEYINLLVGGGTLIRQRLLCNGVELNAVVDTGAYVTVMDESIVDHFKWKIDGAGTPLAGANGNKLVSRGSTLVNVELQIGNVKKLKQHRICVVQNLTTLMLLGLELLREFKVCVDTANLKLVFVKDNVKAGTKTCSKEVTIPPRSQTDIEDRANTVGLVLAAPFQTENRLAIANSIAKTENNSTPIVVATIEEDKLGKFTQPLSEEKVVEESSSSSPDGKEGGEMIDSFVKINKFKDNHETGNQLSQEQVSQPEHLSPTTHEQLEVKVKLEEPMFTEVQLS